MVVKLPIISKVGFGHDTPEVFVTTQWTRQPTKSVLFLLFRWFLAAFYIAIVAYSLSESARYDTTKFWVIYMTHWGIVLCTLSTIYAAFLTGLYHFNVIELTAQSSSYKVLWCLSNLSTVLAFVITIIYWGVLYNGNTSVLDGLIHGGNSMGMFIELCVVRHPMYFVHVVYTIGFGLIYCIFSLVYYFSGGTDYFGNPYIYNIISWGENAGRATLISLGVLVLALFLHIILCLVQRLRHRVHKKIYGSPKSFDV